MPRVSAILPIYNAGPFLRQCLDSIANQTLEDIEILCVNDGSTDDSLEIMREYEARDKRFKVLDKPNGGYGHSLNYGLAHATGEYVSIIEPDDFIDENMYADLYAASGMSEGEAADIVKGSYWEYYDGQEGFKAALKMPNLTSFMPKEPCSFRLEENPEVFCHHPSIWSALYRREFLEQEGIGFVEPKGAGWADNPFFLETMLKAQKIAWVPSGYYYYRQTNTGASSFLKDYHIPFDRLREMRVVLQQVAASDDVVACFYLREFDYIRSVIGEFGFDEGDPELLTLIQEVLDSMDEQIVCSHRRIRSEDIRYYLEFKGRVAATPSNSVVKNPLLTYVVAFQNDRDVISRCLASITQYSGDELEVICVDCGSADRSPALCEAYAKEDARVTLLDATFDTIPAGLNAALEAAQGRYTFALMPKFALCNNAVWEAAKEAEEANLDVVVMDGSGRFCTEILRCSDWKIDPPLNARVDGKDEFLYQRMYGPFSQQQIQSFVFNMGYPSVSTRLYRTSFVRDNKLGYDEQETINGTMFFADAALKAEKMGYKVAEHFEMLRQEYPEVPFVLDVHDVVVREDAEILPAAKAVFQKYVATHPQACANVVLDSFMTDLRTRRTETSYQSYYKAHIDEVTKLLSQFDEDGLFFHNVDTYNDYQLLVNEGFQQFCLAHYLECERDATLLAWDLKELVNSKRLQVGEKLVDFMKRALPTKLIGRVRESIVFSIK